MPVAKKRSRRRSAPPGASAWPLTIYLLKSNVRSWKKALREGIDPAHHTIPKVGTVVVRKAEETVPWWVEKLGKIAPILRHERQRSAGAVLFVTTKNRLFAVTFGLGRTLLDLALIEHDFGIRTVVATVDENELRSVDYRTLENVPLHSRTQAASAKPLSAFSLDRMFDVLKGVTGRSAEDDGTLSGADSFKSTEYLVDASEIRDTCATLLGAFESPLPERFNFLDDIHMVRDPAARGVLDRRLHGELQHANRVSIGLSPNRLLEPSRFNDIRAEWDAGAEETLSDSDIRAKVEDLARKLDVDKFAEVMQRLRIGTWSEEHGVFDELWPLGKSVFAQLAHDGQQYMLSGGEWYQLRNDFISKVEADFDKVIADSSPVVSLPSYAARFRREDQYNAHAAKARSLVLLDRKTMMSGSGATAVEPCDLLDPASGTFIHVKDGRKSSVLSHLFSQGVVSLNSFLEVESARDAVRAFARISSGPLAADRIDPGNLNVVYAIADRPPAAGKHWRLPFFSMLSCLHAARQIRQVGATPHVVRIDAAR